VASESDEARLTARSREGDVAAFNCLVERYQDAAYSLALRLLGSTDAAADVTQDAFLSAFRAIGSFRGTAFRPWLLRIVANGCYDVFRDRGRHPTTSLDVMLQPAADEDAGHAALALPADDRWEPDAAAMRREVIELINVSLLALVPEQRLAVVLSDVQGLTYEEIAEVMQTSLGTVKSRISRGRARLRDLLRSHPELLSGVDRRAIDSIE
jgi:RNA polymerase sigma-70 factor (ECF subfamily)